MPPAKKLAAPGDISHDVPFQLENRRLKISKPGVSVLFVQAPTHPSAGQLEAELE